MINYKNIIGFKGYKASEQGIVFSEKTNKILKPTKESAGYCTVSLRIQGGKKTFRVHSIIANMFVPNPENKETINHINGIKTDNRAVNLEWVTRSENQLHAYKLGLQKPTTPMKGRFGKNNPSSKSVIQLTKDGEFIKEFSGLSEAERKTGIAHSSISKACQGKLKTSGGFTWKYKQL